MRGRVVILATIGAFPNSGSRAGFPFQVPREPTIVGLRLNLQSLLFPDIGANPIDLSMSNAVDVVIQ